MTRTAHTRTIIIYRSIIQEESIWQNCPRLGTFQDSPRRGFPTADQGGQGEKRKLW